MASTDQCATLTRKHTAFSEKKQHPQNKKIPNLNHQTVIKVVTSLFQWPSATLSLISFQAQEEEFPSSDYTWTAIP